MAVRNILINFAAYQFHAMTNHLIIMAGGIGSRFWPYSRNNRPKQFLDFFGTGRSLLQMTIDRFLPFIPMENILVVTNEAYRSLVLEQVPQLSASQILCEPCRRNTAPCIAYATARIAADLAKTNRYADDATIVVAAADHLITDQTAFVKTLTAGLNYAASHSDILTLGMKPTRPETGYGYIQLRSQQLPLGINGEGIYPVVQFREKPDRTTAQQYIASGDYLWNSGMFIFSLPTIINAFKQYLPDVWQQFEEGKDYIGTADEQRYINEHFPLCSNISIDYGIMEKARNVMVMPADFGWSDVGTWGSLYDLSEKDTQGNVTIHAQAAYYNSHNNIVTLENGKLAVVEGLDDYIIVENEGVLLICRKSSEQQIRDFVGAAKEEFR